MCSAIFFLKMICPREEFCKRVSCGKNFLINIICPGETSLILKISLKITCPEESELGKKKFLRKNHLSRRNTRNFFPKMTYPGEECLQKSEFRKIFSENHLFRRNTPNFLAV